MLLCENRLDHKLYFKLCKKKSPFNCYSINVTSHQTSLEVSLHLPDNHFFILTGIIYYKDLRHVLDDSVNISEYYIFNVLNSKY